MRILTRILIDMLGTIKEMSPYLVFGFLVAGVLSVLIRQRMVEKHLGGRGFSQVFKASLFGVPLPLCSCGVIPVAASLRKHGAGKGATTSFLISTPQTGVDSIFVTLSLLGPVYAVFRPLVAFVSGIIGGAAVSIFDGDEDADREKVESPGWKELKCQDGSCSTDHSGGDGACGDSCVPNEEKRGGIREIFKYGFRTLPADINKALVFGILLSGIIGAVIPDDYFAQFLGGGIVAMLVMVVLGVPVYVCATASVPIAAALITKGVSPGAALVFLMTGPATNVATLLTVGRVMGKKTALIYLTTVALSAIGSGLLLDAIYHSASAAPSTVMPLMMPDWLMIASAIFLGIIIAASFIRPVADGHHGRAGEGRLVMEIEGMHCTHCRDSVQRVLDDIKGVNYVDIDLKKGRVVVGGDLPGPEVLAGEVESLGYKVTGMTGNGDDRSSSKDAENGEG
ncbi:MAG: SO_0444 family Cu/Zn efflux transporter [Candidatus Krumholzibacteria bacterium]|nr:SO_0444 family Cu/Zn efflux transporter [Candidatus Krumholzibacteria bacterium]